MLIGAHLSVARGYGRMATDAHERGCECVQVFARSPRRWDARPLDPDRVADMVRLRGSGEVGPLLTHTSYLINLSGIAEDQRRRSIAALSDELVRGGLLGADSVNTHVGTSTAHAPLDAPASDLLPLPVSAREAARRAAEAIDIAWQRAEGELASQGVTHRARLVLENTAGAGSSFGSTVGELAAIVEMSGLDVAHLGICIDTCHACAAGWDLSDGVGWDGLLGRVDALVGIERLRWMHVNDCRHPRGAHRDRHAWLGRGCMGVRGFAALMGDDRLSTRCAVVEMPGEDPAKDTVNVAFLKALRDGVEPQEALRRATALFPDAEPVGIAGA